MKALQYICFWYTIKLCRYIDRSTIFKHFFESVRANKCSGDNLGEELLAICLYILSNLPGEEDGKFSVITDDKGAAGKIKALFDHTNKNHRGKATGIFSTPKFVQILCKEQFLNCTEHMIKMLNAGTEGNIVVLGMYPHDIHINLISLSKEQLTDLIMQPNGIYVAF